MLGFCLSQSFLCASVSGTDSPPLFFYYFRWALLLFGDKLVVTREAGEAEGGRAGGLLAMLEDRAIASPGSHHGSRQPLCSRREGGWVKTKSGVGARQAGTWLARPGVRLAPTRLDARAVLVD